MGRLEVGWPVRSCSNASRPWSRFAVLTPRSNTTSERDGVSLHLTEWHEHDPKRTGAVVYIYVSDADAVHAEWAQADVAGRLSEPHGTDYGLREFGYVDPEGTLHKFGSRPPESPTR